MSNNTLLRGMKPAHPGALLREDVLPELGRTKTDIARLLGISRQTLYDILDEKQPITPTMALRIGKLCGNGPDIWLNMQRAFDLHQARQELGAALDAIPNLNTAA